MKPSDKSSDIYNAFYRYVEDGNKNEIESFSKEDLEFTLIQYSADINRPPCVAMKKRVEELKIKEIHDSKPRLTRLIEDHPFIKLLIWLLSVVIAGVIGFYVNELLR